MSSSMSITPVLAGLGLNLGGSILARALPEPRNSLAQWGEAVVDTGMDAVGSMLGSSSADLTQLLNMQVQIQREMQLVSMVSNLYKSQHEIEMAPIRNMRVG